MSLAGHPISSANRLISGSVKLGTLIVTEDDYAEAADEIGRWVYVDL